VTEKKDPGLHGRVNPCRIYSNGGRRKARDVNWRKEEGAESTIYWKPWPPTEGNEGSQKQPLEIQEIIGPYPAHHRLYDATFGSVL